MAEKFTVVRQHLGEKMYMPGDEREANAADVAHLVENGVLKPLTAKAEPALKNKAEKPAANKDDAK